MNASPSDMLEIEIRHLIVESLKLEEVEPASIDVDEPLFGGGLGLDSIDALEIGIALRKRYGLLIETATEEVKAHFRSVRSLAAFVGKNRRN
jgi:acyl carrier protein